MMHPYKLGAVVHVVLVSMLAAREEWASVGFFSAWLILWVGLWVEDIIKKAHRDSGESE